MHRSRWIVVLGAVVALTPLSGLPLTGKSAVEILSGLSIIGLSVWSQIDRKLSQKAKAQMRAMRKAAPEAPVIVAAEEGAETDAPKVPPVSPVFGKRVTDFYPKTGQSGRRASDLKPPTINSSEEDSLI